MALLPFVPIQQRGGSGTSRHRGPLTSLLTAGAMSGFAGGAGPSGLDRMPSIPTDALLDADDLMQLDDALNFEVDEALAFAPPGVSIPPVGEGLTDVGIQPISAARPGRGPSSHSVGGFALQLRGCGPRRELLGTTRRSSSTTRPETPFTRNTSAGSRTAWPARGSAPRRRSGRTSWTSSRRRWRS